MGNNQNTSMGHGNLDDLVKHNSNLVKTAQQLAAQLRAACLVMGLAVDAAEPIAEQHGDVVEYAIPADAIEGLRGVIMTVRAAGWYDK